MSLGEERPPVSSFERGLRVLIAIYDRDQVRVEDLVTQLALPASTVYRYLRPLRELDLVAESDGYYGVGSRLAADGRAVSNETLTLLARPILTELARDTGETALVTIRVGSHVLCLDQVQSRRPVRMAFEVGQVLPLQAGAASRVLLAYAPAEVVERALGDDPPAHTPATPDARKLRRQLESTRALGYTASRAEFIPGAYAIAVPVFHGDEAVAGLCLAGPANRCTHDWQLTARPLLIDAGHRLGEQLS
jgi:DNA-binding IclR family transcriptional regulator